MTHRIAILDEQSFKKKMPEGAPIPKGTFEKKTSFSAYCTQILFLFIIKRR